MTQANYDRYDEWKGWGENQFMVLTPFERAYFSAEFVDVPIRHGDKVLEIGFGSGTLLAWLSEQGADIYGTELSSQGVTLAAQRGVSILDADLNGTEALNGQFSVVAAFDVIEHLTHQQIAALLDKAATLLRPGGHLIARFPNGASPFGRLHQHADITHVTTMTTEKLIQLMLGKPFEVQRTGNVADASYGSLHIRLAKRGRVLLRRGFERGVSMLYGFKLAFGPNLTVVLRRVGDNTVEGLVRRS